MAGGRSCEAPLAPFRVGGRVTADRERQCTVPMFTYSHHSICPDSGHSFLPGRRLNGANSPIHSPRLLLPPPGPHCPPRGSSLRGGRLTASIRFRGKTPWGRGVDLSGSLGRRAGTIQDGRDEGIGPWARGHGGRRGAYVSPFFLLPRGDAMGPSWTTCGWSDGGRR